MTLFDPPEGGAPEAQGPFARVRMTVAYDGGPYHGFAENPGVKTVGGELRCALERVTRAPLTITCAGRTDRGVHARGQVIHFDVPERCADPVSLQRSVNGLLGPTIAVRDSEVVGFDFDARHSARARRYRYTVWNQAVPDPFLARFSWHVPGPLDIDLLRLACDPLIGEHDFAAFCRRAKRADGAVVTTVRRVLTADWSTQGDGALVFDVEATSFCHQMVRSLVGLLVEVGGGRRHAGDITSVIASGDRARAARVAPPHGLCLWQVRY